MDDAYKPSNTPLTALSTDSQCRTCGQQQPFRLLPNASTDMQPNNASALIKRLPWTASVFSLLLSLAAMVPGSAAAEHHLSHGPPISAPAGTSTAVRPADLDRLVNEAAIGNPETLSKRANLEAAEASVDAAFQQFFPSPYAQAQQGSSQNKNLTTNTSDRTGLVGVRQPIWTGGKLTADLNVAKASALSADCSIAETQLALAQRVVAAFQNLMLSRGRVKAQLDGIELLEKYAVMMERRVQSSVSASVDQTLIQSRLTQARSDLSTFQSGEQTALAQLSQLIGRPLKSVDVTCDFATALAPPRDQDEVLRQALQTNPTLRRMDADIKTVTHQEAKQQAALMPTLSVKAEYENGLFERNATNEDTRIYATLDFSPGAGLSALANIRSATARVSGTRLAQDAARRDVTARIQADHEDCSNAYARQRLIGQTVQSSREVLESYTRLFVAGKRSWLDVLNSARELTQNELVMADILAAYRASDYRLRLYAGEMSWLQAGRRAP